MHSKCKQTIRWSGVLTRGPVSCSYVTQFYLSFISTFLSFFFSLWASFSFRRKVKSRCQMLIWYKHSDKSEYFHNLLTFLCYLLLIFEFLEVNLGRIFRKTKNDKYFKLFKQFKRYWSVKGMGWMKSGTIL